MYVCVTYVIVSRTLYQTRGFVRILKVKISDILSSAPIFSTSVNLEN